MPDENQSHYALFEKVGRIDGTVTSLEKKMDSLLGGFTDYQKSIDERVKSLERDRSNIMGGVLAISVFVSIIYSLIKDWFHK